MPKGIEYNSRVVLTFALISLIATMLGNATEHLTTTAVFCVYRSSPKDPLFYLRLFGHVFGHNDWGHFSSNMLMLLLTGPLLEEKYGSRMMLYLILFTALATGLIHIAFFPETVLLGSSGVVFAFILLASFTGDGQGKIPLTFIIIAIIYLGREVLTAVTVEDQISHLAHVIGGTVGCVFGYRFKSSRTV